MNPAGEPHLQRRFGLLQSVALNMSNMIGIGPFITIPALMTAMGGPQSLLGWFVALVIALPDGLIWSELGAAMPGSGGSYLYLKEGFNPRTWGRLMAFLFIWQFILSGPLEIASGLIGFAQYLKYLTPSLSLSEMRCVQVIVGLAAVLLLYRKISDVGWITVSLWAGTLLTLIAVLGTGLTHFNPHVAFDFPKNAWKFDSGFLLGLGSAAQIGMYDYLGYYDICYIGDEVRHPGKTIPRSILISLLAVAAIYFGLHLSIIGTIPWREFVPAGDPPMAVASVLMERIHGVTAANILTVMVLWTAFGAVYALLLGYSRIPFAAAQDGYFFRIFGRLHPTKNFPHLSLLVIGAVSIVCSFLTLDLVIAILMVTRIIVQFMGQIIAVMLLRKRNPSQALPFRMWLYPLPALLAFAGWYFLFYTTGERTKLFGLGSLALGVLFFFIWSAWNSTWPFGRRGQRPNSPVSP